MQDIPNPYTGTEAWIHILRRIGLPEDTAAPDSAIIYQAPLSADNSFVQMLYIIEAKDDQLLILAIRWGKEPLEPKDIDHALVARMTDCPDRLLSFDQRKEILIQWKTEAIRVHDFGKAADLCRENLEHERRGR